MKVLTGVLEGIWNALGTAALLAIGVVVSMYYMGYISVVSLTKHITVITITY